jgi:hypothetical protein
MSRSKGKVPLNNNTALKVSHGRDGKAKVAFSSAKDSDDEYSSVGTLTPKSTLQSPAPTTPNKALTPNKRTPKDTPGSGGIFSSLFGQGKKGVYMDSDDETSRNVTPVNTNDRHLHTPKSAMSKMPTVQENPSNERVVAPQLVNPVKGTNPVTPEDAKRLARNIRTMNGKGIVIQKVVNGTITDVHERVLFLDPQNQFLFWTDKANLECSEDTLKAIRSKLTASSKQKSFLGGSDKNSGTTELTKNRKHTVLLSTIDSITVGSGEFSQFITLNMKPGAASGVYKMIIFKVENKADYELVLRVLGSLLVPAPKSKYAVHFS